LIKRRNLFAPFHFHFECSRVKSSLGGKMTEPAGKIPGQRLDSECANYTNKLLKLLFCTLISNIIIELLDIIHHPIFKLKNRPMDNVQKVHNCINIPPS
jgi:hypothetical protein